MSAHSCGQRNTCAKPCLPATNGIGWTIEEYGADGWSAEKQTPHACPVTASAALALIPADNVERRVYEALQPRITKE